MRVAMAWIGEKIGTGAHAGEMAAIASSRPDPPEYHTVPLPDGPGFRIGEC